MAILSCASKLATSRLSSVSVVPDLTKKQREMDEEVRREADRRNREELTDDDRSKNLRWVAVGRKGARKIIKKVFTERVPNSHLPNSHLPNSTRPTSGSNSIIISQNRKQQASGDQPRVAKKKQKKKTAGGEVQPAVEDQLAENAQQESEEEYLEVEESEVEEDEMEEENI